MCDEYCSECNHCKEEDFKRHLESLKHRLKVKFGLVTPPKPDPIDKYMFEQLGKSLNILGHRLSRKKKLPKSGSLVTFKRYSNGKA